MPLAQSTRHRPPPAQWSCHQWRWRRQWVGWSSLGLHGDHPRPPPWHPLPCPCWSNPGSCWTARCQSERGQRLFSAQQNRCICVDQYFAPLDQAQDFVELLVVNVKEDRAQENWWICVNTLPLLITPCTYLNCSSPIWKRTEIFDLYSCFPYGTHAKMGSR